MKICIMTRTPSNYTEKRLLEEALSAGHEAFCIKPTDCIITIDGDKAWVTDLNLKVIEADVVIPRIQRELSSYDRAVLRQFETNGAYVLAKSLAVERSFDIVRALQLLRRNGVSIQKTIIGRFAPSSSDVLSQFSMPVAIRSTATGADMVATSNEKTARSLIRAAYGDSSYTIIQRVPTSEQRQNISAVVLGSSILASLRMKNDGEFVPVKLGDDICKVVSKIAPTLGITFCTISLILYSDSYVISRIDVSPKLEVFEETTGRNVVGRVIEYIGLNAKRGQKKDKIGA